MSSKHCTWCRGRNSHLAGCPTRSVLVCPPRVLTFENAALAPPDYLDSWDGILVEQGPPVARPLHRVN